jgi:cytochrome P450
MTTSCARSRVDAARITDSAAGSIFDSPMARALNAEGQERWRRMVGKWFTAKRMQALVPRIEARAEHLIDGMLEQGQPADLVRHLAFPLPVYVIRDVLRVPEGDRDDFKTWSDTFLNLSRYTAEEMAAAHQNFGEYMAALVAQKRRHPQDDLISRLIAATDAEGRPMSGLALAATGQALLLAGHETTAGFLTTMAAVLLADRRRWERLLLDRSLIRPAVEEVLRWESCTGFGMLRYVHEDTEVPSGAVLAQGSTVVCSMAAANRDADAFQRAEEMEPGRTPNPHLAFGAGRHSCLGQPLARTEMQTVLGVLLRRLPTLDLAVDPARLSRVEGLLTTPLRELPVRW